jgi:hypothetical protein
MIINKKLTSGDHFTNRNFLNSSIVNTPLTDVSLRVMLGRIRTTISLVTRLVAIPARLVGWRNVGTALPRSILWQRNCVSLAKPSLSVILLLRWAIPDIGSRWTILSFGHHWSLRLRSTYPKISFTSFGSSIYLIIVLLSQSITDKLIESDTLTVAQRLHQFKGKPPLEASYLLGINIYKFRGIPGQVVKRLEVLIYAFVALSQLHELGMLNCHKARRNKMSLESLRELVPNNLNICREGGPMMVPPYTCGSLQLMSPLDRRLDAHALTTHTYQSVEVF